MPSSWSPWLFSRGPWWADKEAEGRGARPALEDEASSAQHGAEVLVGRKSEDRGPEPAHRWGQAKPHLCRAEKRLLGLSSSGPWGSTVPRSLTQCK